MKKPTHPRKRATASAKLAVAATVLPLVASPSVLYAQRPGVKMPQGTIQRPSTMYLKFSDRFLKYGNQLTIAGLDNGHTIYRNSRGELFYLDPQTGDMKFVPKETFIKWSTGVKLTGAPLTMLKYEGIKWNRPVTVLGVDAQGNVVQKNAQGQKFYLNPTTGDMVFVN